MSSTLFSLRQEKNMENKTVDEYKTKDLGEAGSLIVKGENLIRIERNGKVCWFVFQDKAECLRISNLFFFGRLEVNARDYFEALGRLKNRIFHEV